MTIRTLRKFIYLPKMVHWRIGSPLECAALSLFGGDAFCKGPRLRFLKMKFAIASGGNSCAAISL